MREAPSYIFNNGTKIQIDPILGSTAGILVKQQYLDARKPGVAGTIKGWVGGHGGDIYWVEHEDGTIAVYGWAEFELAPAPTRYERLRAQH